MRQVRHLLESKGGTVYRADPGESVLNAIKRMAEHRIGALVVIDGEQLLGLVSERDYARKVILHKRSSADTAVREIMSAPVISVGPDATVAECMRLCTDERVRHLPVIEEGRIVGVVSIGDLVKAVIDEQAQEIEQLQRYISG